ncbi:unnamed protein product, partial [Pylaiella littoralis]
MKKTTRKTNAPMRPPIPIPTTSPRPTQLLNPLTEERTVDGDNSRTADSGIAGDLIDSLALANTSVAPSPPANMVPVYAAMLKKHNRKGTEPPAWLLKLLMPVGD